MKQQRQGRRRRGKQLGAARAAAMAGLVLAVGAAVARADAIIGDWEDTTDGWIDWSNAQQPIAAPKFTYDTVGVTSGNKSLKIEQVGWGQNLSLKLQLFANGVKEYRP